MKHQTVEDAVDFLLSLSGNYRTMPKRDQPRLSMQDRKVLEDIRGRTWWANQGLTQKQRNLVQQLVGKYLLLLKVHKWPVDDLLDPQWRSPLAEPIVYHSWSVEYDAEQDCFSVTSPYERKSTQLVNELSGHTMFLDHIHFPDENNRRVWTVTNGHQGKTLIQTLLKVYNCYYDATVVEQLKQSVEHQQPTVSYLNGSWHINHASEPLINRFQHIVSGKYTPLQEAFYISEAAVAFDSSARRYLRRWLTETQVNLLCDDAAVTTASKVDVLHQLIQAVDIWPVVLICNRWDRGFNTILEKPVGWVYHEAYQREEQWTSAENRPTLIVADHEGQIRLPKNYFVPWFVRYQSVVDNYIHDDTFNHHKRVMVGKD